MRRQIDQSVRTHNYKARKERKRQEYWSRVKKGRETSALKKKSETAFNADSFQAEIPVVPTSLILVNGHNHPLLLQERRHRLMEESLTCFALSEE